jgi:hypothetical protein
MQDRWEARGNQESVGHPVPYSGTSRLPDRSDSWAMIEDGHAPCLAFPGRALWGSTGSIDGLDAQGCSFQCVLG